MKKLLMLSMLAFFIMGISSCKYYKPTSATTSGPWTFLGPAPIKVITGTGGTGTVGVANIRCWYSAPVTVTYTNPKCSPKSITRTATAYFYVDDPNTLNKLPVAVIGASLPLPGWAGRIPQPFSIDINVWFPPAANTIAENRCKVLGPPPFPKTWTTLPAPIVPKPEPIKCP